ncbi:hypothetical protein IWX90DRAFT_434713 [Phyllosticta citrichinensis]|uniref:Uncharacterized protein n=1 Tax=Phyllosticta citrichinensis TaxID=1130410 RepID=A0ABR1XV03_9PEZI
MAPPPNPSRLPVAGKHPAQSKKPTQAPVAGGQSAKSSKTASDPEHLSLFPNLVHLFGEMNDAYDDIAALTNDQVAARKDSMLAYDALSPEVTAHNTEVNQQNADDHAKIKDWDEVKLAENVELLLEMEIRFQSTSPIAAQIHANRERANAAIVSWKEARASLKAAGDEEQSELEKFATGIKAYVDKENAFSDKVNQVRNQLSKELDKLITAGVKNWSFADMQEAQDVRPLVKPASELIIERAKGLRTYRNTAMKLLLELAVANERIKDEWHRALELLPVARVVAAKTAYKDAKEKEAAADEEMT